MEINVVFSDFAAFSFSENTHVTIPRAIMIFAGIVLGVGALISLAGLFQNGSRTIAIGGSFDILGGTFLLVLKRILCVGYILQPCGKEIEILRSKIISNEKVNFNVWHN